MPYTPTYTHMVLITFIAAFLGGQSREIIQAVYEFYDLSVPAGEGLSIMQWFVFGLAIRVWPLSDHNPASLKVSHTYNLLRYVVLLAVVILLCVPSAQVSWIAMFMLSIFMLIQDKSYHHYRYSLYILLALSANELMTYLLIKFMTMPILSIDVMLTASALKLLTGVGSAEGNIIFGPAEHQLMVLRGCSSLSNVSIAILLWFSIARVMRMPFGKHDIIMLLIIGFSVISINIARLTWMALDVDMHAWFHQESGELAYQLVFATVLFTLIRRGIRYA